MSDWMNKLEDELGSLVPNSSGRDLVAAALCEHRDSKVVTARRLRREPSASELETAFAVLEARYPGLIAADPNEASSMAVAFVRTPGQKLATQQTKATSPTRGRGLMKKLSMAVALLLFFAGGIAIGLRVGDSSGSTIASSDPGPTPRRSVVQLPGHPESRVAQAEKMTVEATPVVASPPTGRGRQRPGRQRSSLLDLSRQFHRTRLGVTQPSL